MKKILVTGGAGYIGSHMTAMLKLQGEYEPIVFDNFSTGRLENIIDGVKIIEGDLADKEKLEAFFSENQFDAVMHFAGSIEVGESVIRPEKYYFNNVFCTLHLLDAMMKHDVKKIIFSSTAAVYGNPLYTPMDLDHPCLPVNPYGQSKLMVEKILNDYETAYGLKSICLRYFNAAAFSPDFNYHGRRGEVTHLIPLVLKVASGEKSHVSIYGNDYETHDGTCIRDYIHVNDLCSAHVLALKKMERELTSGIYNLGNEKGFSVLEVIAAAEKITGKKIKKQFIDRRPGDPAIIIADSKKAKEELDWSPMYADLETIIQHAWEWEKRR